MLYNLILNSITIFVQITNCIFQNYSHAMSFYGIQFLAGTGQSSFFLALLTLRQSINTFCWASFMIGSQICFNFWVKLAALLWQLRQELFQPFLAVLPLRPWDCHFQPFDNCTIGTFFAGNRFHRRPCHVIWFLIFNLPRQKCLHLQILAFAISEYLGKWKNMATVYLLLSKARLKTSLEGRRIIMINQVYRW